MVWMWWAVTCTAWDSLTQTAGHPGDHIGVGVTLTAPGGTCFGRAAWRLPLQILDDEAFCDDMAAMNLQYLEASRASCPHRCSQHQQTAML